MCSKYDYRLTSGAVEKIKDRISQEKNSLGSDFANARTVRNIFEAIITKQSIRTADSSDQKELTLIKEEDIL